MKWINISDEIDNCIRLYKAWFSYSVLLNPITHQSFFLLDMRKAQESAEESVYKWQHRKYFYNWSVFWSDNLSRIITPLKQLLSQEFIVHSPESPSAIKITTVMWNITQIMYSPLDMESRRQFRCWRKLCREVWTSPERWVWTTCTK